jgi:hypothetical protein
MDDKMFDLMTQMYSELKDLKTEVKKIGNQVTIIEQEHGQKLEALLDGYKQLYEGQQEIKADIKDLKDKQENQELQIKVIKTGKAG